jgi:outer membrane lipopolysaccharide assembly protein LptE/RlpB
MRVPVLLMIASALAVSACGYRLHGGGSALGEGQVLGVPMFGNQTSEFRIEQRLTEAVRRELIRGTRYRVVPEGAGDVVLTGRVLGVTTAPTVFTDQGRAIVYTVAVRMNVRVTDGEDGALIYEDDDVTFREIFEVSNESASFVPEDGAALERLARQFSGSLVASLTRVLP